MAEEDSYTVCCAQSQLQHYTKTLAFIWLISHLALKKHRSGSQESQHGSHSTLAVTLRATHKSKMCVFTKQTQNSFFFHASRANVGKMEAFNSEATVTGGFRSYEVTVDPLAQAFNGGFGDLAAKTLPFLCVHHLKNTPQLFQKVKSSQASHERRGGGLAIKHAVRVVQSLGACWTAARNHDLQGALR